jgi:hypothetical protein
MANRSQSQDVEHTGPKSNLLRSRQRQFRGSSEKAVQTELHRRAEAGPEQQEGDESNLSPHGSDTPSRPD